MQGVGSAAQQLLEAAVGVDHAAFEGGQVGADLAEEFRKLGPAGPRHGRTGDPVGVEPLRGFDAGTGSLLFDFG